MAKWSEKIMEKWNSGGNIAEQIDAIQGIYTKQSILCFVLICAGGGMIAACPTGQITFFGLFMMILGVIGAGGLRVWANLRLSILRVLWEMQKDR